MESRVTANVFTFTADESCLFIFFLQLDYLFLNVPQKVKTCISQFPRDGEEVFFKSLFWFTNTAKIKKRHKTKTLQFEKLDPADKANHFFCYFAFKISQMTDWFFKNCFNFVLTSVLLRPSVDSFGEDIFTCELSSLFEDFYKPRKKNSDFGPLVMSRPLGWDFCFRYSFMLIHA